MKVQLNIKRKPNDIETIYFLNNYLKLLNGKRNHLSTLENTSGIILPIFN